MAKFLILDTETTGVSKTDEIIELAYLEGEKIFSYKNLSSIEMLEIIAKDIIVERFRPSVQINPRAFEVHGITFKELLKCPPSNSFIFPNNVTDIIGHNVAFDHRMLKNPSVRLTCTMGLAKIISKRLDLKLENHQLDTITKYFYPEVAEKIQTRYHSAKVDVLKTTLLMLKYFELLPGISSLEGMYNFQQIMGNKK